jgi:hypothetical protein
VRVSEREREKKSEMLALAHTLTLFLVPRTDKSCNQLNENLSLKILRQNPDFDWIEVYGSWQTQAVKINFISESFFIPFQQSPFTL